MRLCLLCFFLFMLSCNRTNQKHGNNNASTDTLPRILTYGLKDKNRWEAVQLVAARYGFTYYSVAGCVVSHALMDSVKRENQIVYAVLDYRLGKNWQQRFLQDVDTMYQQLSDIGSLKDDEH